MLHLLVGELSLATPMGNYYDAPKISFVWLGQGWHYFRAKPGVWAGSTAIAAVVLLALCWALVFPTGAITLFMTSANKPATLRSVLYGSSPAEFAANNAIGLALNIVATIFEAGMVRMAIRQIGGKDITLADLFSLGGVFPAVVGVAVATSVIECVANMAFIVPSLIAGGLMMFAPAFAVGSGAGTRAAIASSVRLLAGQWPMAAAYYLIGSLFAMAGGCACIVGAFVTAPVFVISIAYGYLVLMNARQDAPSYGPAVPGVWPPPPNIEQERPHDDGSANRVDDTEL